MSIPTNNNSKHILIIDDEEMMGDVISLHLEDFGYTTTFYQEPKKAVKFFEENWEKIDLVLLDMEMPEMRGPEVLDDLRVINPDIRVIIISGYTENCEINKVLKKGAGFIRKPFIREKLLGGIKAMLN